MGVLNVGTAIGLWMALTTGLSMYFLPYRNVITGNLVVTNLLIFNNLNILISICEVCLGLNIAFIKEDYQKLRETYKGKEAKACVAYLTMPLTVAQVFDPKTWSKMWSTYALYDPSYQNHESFGFFIDFGNGMSTVLPCVLINAAMVLPDMVSPLLVGCVGLAVYWQIMYGAIIYILSFLFNRRWEGKRILEVATFVLVINSLWIVFPLIGMYACVCILRDGDLKVFSNIQ
uniref:Uncharacterized protein n=1 Tax=Trieres chinensis TaxID=1514140 RepID=A0A7S2ENY4_TRICV|mmetsp:Transcript_31347/g.64135  ORF Transcript_31347/g.64135 Transcript_31347/m.64135 type:complete len:231 (+) Transcript_31347:141-833(+)